MEIKELDLFLIELSVGKSQGWCVKSMQIMTC